MESSGEKKKSYVDIMGGGVEVPLSGLTAGRSKKPSSSASCDYWKKNLFFFVAKNVPAK